MSDGPREYTKDEVRANLFAFIRGRVQYWSSVPGKTTIEQMNGLVGSILVALDGCAQDLPGFILAPYPDGLDRKDRIENGENYYPEQYSVIWEVIKCDLAPDLHEHWARENQGQPGGEA